MFNDGGNRGTSLLQRVKRRVCEELSVPPSTAKERFRHELKYLISYAQKTDLNVRMAPLLGLDKHASNGGYMIRSLYFDDYWNTAYQEKVDGVLLRKKYRIRIYDYSDRVIKLERKRKSDSWIYKRMRRSPMSSSTAFLTAITSFCATASINCAASFMWNACAMCCVRV